ncbi:unnamed protein product [Dicrocoelium dendriticum]|nr:unnamed protein product [Dicrocoelium dendriticum]
MNLILYIGLGTCLFCCTRSVPAQKEVSINFTNSGRKGVTRQHVYKLNGIELEGNSKVVGFQVRAGTHTEQDDKGKGVQSCSGSRKEKPAEPSLSVGIIFNLKSYGNWSKWSHCKRAYCIQSRLRECTDDTWKQPKLKRYQFSRCASRYYIETRPCEDKKACATPAMRKNCGVRPGFVGPAFKILGGESSEPNAWPWAVRLTIQSGVENATTLCGATLIDPRWIVTAAHCLKKLIDINPFDAPSSTVVFSNISLYAHLGDHRKSKLEVTEKIHLVQKAILHPAFLPADVTTGADIALLYLAEPAKLRSEVNFACVPYEFMAPKPGTECYAVGWGMVESKSNKAFRRLLSRSDKYNPIHHMRGPYDEMLTSDRLHEVSLPIVSNNDCKTHHTILNERFHICAGSTGKDTCRGDSGGGLYCQVPNSSDWFIAGVTSFGHIDGCGRSPGVYTSVIAHRDWIRRTIKEAKSKSL